MDSGLLAELSSGRAASGRALGSPRNDKLDRLAVKERRDGGVLPQALDILRCREVGLSRSALTMQRKPSGSRSLRGTGAMSSAAR